MGADVVAAFDSSVARAGVHAAENEARQELRAGLEVLEQQASASQMQSATRAWRRPRSATLWRLPGNDPNWQPQEFSGAPAAMAFTKPAGDAAQAHWRRAPFDSKPRGVKGDARAVLAQMRPGGTERRALLHMSSAQKRKFFDRKLAERAHMVKATAPPSSSRLGSKVRTAHGVLSVVVLRKTNNKTPSLSAKDSCRRRLAP